MVLSAHLPGNLNPTVYPSKPIGAGPFPEFQLGAQSKRYLPTQYPVGVCISGGGPRSYSAAIGQMRGLTAILGNVLGMVGAISCVSGGAWFGTAFSYVPTSIGDDELLGPLIAPAKLTRNDVDLIGVGNLGAPLLRLTNEAIISDEGYYQFKVLEGDLPENRVYSRIIGDRLLAPWGLDDPSVFFSLDGIPGLASYTVRPNRPYFIANATQIYPDDETGILRHIEYSPLYCGTSQLFTTDLPFGLPFGGGYVSSFGFDSITPLSPSNPTTVQTPDPIFTLSDIMGSSGAAPGGYLDQIGLPDVGLPEFNYWPPANMGQIHSYQYSMVDGGLLEDTGIVALLRRQYPFIIAFVNAELPIGSTSDQAVDGISEQVSRLFGLNPADTDGNNQDTQVFGATKQEGQALFARLAAGLKASQYSGATFADTYTIYPDNSFAIPPYPQEKSPPYRGGGEVRVLWGYLNFNRDWFNAITNPYVRNLLSTYDFSNFPNYNTVFQNFGELLLLTTPQIQLLAHMTAFCVAGGKSGEMFAAFHKEVTDQM